MPVEPVVMRPDRPLPGWMLRAWELVVPWTPRWVVRGIGRFFLRFLPGSRARRWFLLRVSMIAWDANSRNRDDLVLPIWDRECEWHWDPGFQSVGFDEVYRGHDGVRRSLNQINEMFTDRSFTVREILDGGDTIVLRLDIAARGVRSGVPGETKLSAVARLDPLIVDYYNFRDDADAMREAGFAQPRGQTR
jgi:SnoaL-like protein